MPDGLPRLRIAGDSVPLRGTTHTWQASSPSAGRPHRYRWYREGVEAGSGDSYTADAGSADFELRVEMTDTYGRTASTYRQVDVDGMAVGISGPDELLQGDSGLWTAEIDGGYPPYTIRWYQDGVLRGTGTRVTAYAESEFVLRADVTDSHGSRYNGSKSVSIRPSSTCTTMAC